jgi:hypothetical protein
MNIKLVIALSACCAWNSAAIADDAVEIKGFHVGMTRSEVKARESDFCYDHLGCDLTHKTRFTVGGVNAKKVSATYSSNAMADSIEFEFGSSGFSRLKAALIEKYPGTECKSEDVTNLLGNHFEQVICRYETGTGGIYLARYDRSLLTSVMFVMSADKKELIEERLAAAKKDL